jgi:hypothetical protein
LSLRLCLFAAAAFFCFVFAAADGFDVFFAIAEAVFAIAIAAVTVAIESNLEVLLEERISNSEECTYAYDNTDNSENHLESIISLFHDKYLRLLIKILFLYKVYHKNKKIQ